MLKIQYYRKKTQETGGRVSSTDRDLSGRVREWKTQTKPNPIV